jgi:hypothetical protein
MVSPFPVCGISSGDAAHNPEPSLTFATEGENKMNREELINEVLNQILQDVKDFDLTAIEELIKHIPDEALMAYLPEATEGETNEI